MLDLGLWYRRGLRMGAAGKGGSGSAQGMVARQLTARPRPLAGRSLLVGQNWYSCTTVLKPSPQYVSREPVSSRSQSCVFVCLFLASLLYLSALLGSVTTRVEDVKAGAKMKKGCSLFST